jgi:His Kinase A (phosphoacceptor) domain./Histidine kinase-, DNA gyrase B-, and HSP90-like ATPase.
MKLIYKIILRICILLVLFLGIWLFYFYNSAFDELYDEIDDSLSLQADKIMDRFIESDTLPLSTVGEIGNNSFSIEKVSEGFALDHPNKEFNDETIFINDIMDEEPARVLTMVFKKQDVFYLLTVLTPTFERSDVLRTIFNSAMILVVALIISAVLSVGLVVYNSMKPMYKMLKWLKCHKVGDQIPADEDLKVETQEFKSIKNAVLEASRRSNEIFEQQKRFIGNASHEIQTPVAICKNRLEILIDETELTEFQLEEIDKTLNTLDHISKLNKSLLLITKIDSDQFLNTEEIPISKMIQPILTDLSEVYSYKSISTSLEADTDLSIKINKSLAVSLLSNLLKNGFIHNIKNGFIEAKTFDNKLVIRNTGIHQALDAKRIFERFYKDNTKESSSGLGLSIVESICRKYNFDIQYAYDNGWHSFTVDFGK